MTWMCGHNAPGALIFDLVSQLFTPRVWILPNAPYLFIGREGHGEGVYCGGGSRVRRGYATKRIRETTKRCSWEADRRGRVDVNFNSPDGDSDSKTRCDGSV